MRTRFLPLLLILWTLAFPARADHIVVIVHPDSPLKQLTARELSDLYLGRTLASGNRIIVLDQPRDSTLRADFFRKINGMDLSRVNAYWARLQFSGQMQPPPNLPDSQQIIEFVRRNPLAVGYIESKAITGAVRPVLTLEN
jgi:ABC-type phosphate transport system substrate-binding protein